MKMKEKKIRKTWKGILCLVIIVMMLCGSTMVFAETGELTTQCIDANAFISDPWGTVGNAISNGISNGVNALRYGDLYRRYGDFSVTLQMGNGSEVIGPNTIVSWIRVSDNGNEYYDDGKLNEYASNLAAKYNSTETKNTFMTSYGYEISIPSTTYSWVLNQQATANAIRNALYAHQTQTIYPVWAQTAGNASTYVEISLTNQRLFLYKDGQQIMATDVVTGNTALGRGTPAGYYTIKSKARNTGLRGEGYASPVSYWMPFNGGIGLHDATWRGSFGGTIYQYDGSHGCVNMPLDKARIAYENVSVGTPVILYW